MCTGDDIVVFEYVEGDVFRDFSRVADGQDQNPIFGDGFVMWMIVSRGPDVCQQPPVLNVLNVFRKIFLRNRDFVNSVIVKFITLPIRVTEIYYHKVAVEHKFRY